ncbi:MAG: deoxyribodipyrimidine photo-lyase/cryptochrome family protein, partial [Spirosomataceae bacterium]
LENPHYSHRHWHFVWESLQDIQREIQLINPKQKVLIAQGDALTIFQKIHEIHPIQFIFSHQETGLSISFERDKSVKKWTKNKNIQWLEFQSNGIVRGCKDRENWVKDWHTFMHDSLKNPNLTHLSPPSSFFELNKLGSEFPVDIPLPVVPKKQVQVGGQSKAKRYLESFLWERSIAYSSSLSKPQASRQHLSRLSPYIAWGNLSIREIYQRYLEIKKHVSHAKQLDNFASRLRWHCHFIQKFETEYQLEFYATNRAYEEVHWQENEAHLLAWKEGKTGFPLIDACMRCLHETGYINFRMRALLVSFLCHVLYQNWRNGVTHLAQLFLDFEPGIHYPQFQMQAAVTGLNTIRIYNPIKQSKDHDPDGSFIRKWVPELAACNTAYVHCPWEMSILEQEKAKCLLGKHYPLPIVDLESALKNAKDSLYSFKKSRQVKENNPTILKKHIVPNTLNREKKRKKRIHTTLTLFNE